MQLKTEKLNEQEARAVITLGQAVRGASGRIYRLAQTSTGFEFFHATYGKWFPALDGLGLKADAPFTAVPLLTKLEGLTYPEAKIAYEIYGACITWGPYIDKVGHWLEDGTPKEIDLETGAVRESTRVGFFSRATWCLSNIIPRMRQAPASSPKKKELWQEAQEVVSKTRCSWRDEYAKAMTAVIEFVVDRKLEEME